MPLLEVLEDEGAGEVLDDAVEGLVDEEVDQVVGTGLFDVVAEALDVVARLFDTIDVFNGEVTLDCLAVDAFVVRVDEVCLDVFEAAAVVIDAGVVVAALDVVEAEAVEVVEHGMHWK